MIKSLLVCIDGSPYGDVAAEYAVSLAGRVKARLIGLHVLDTRMLEGPLLSDISGWVGAQMYGTQLSQFRDLLQQKGEAVLQAFDARCEKAAVKAESLLKMGHPPRVILDTEALAEMLILGQKGEHAEWIGEMVGSTIERVVRQSIKPCLVTPAAFRPVTKILVGFDGSDPSSKAVGAAVEMALALNVPLVLLSVAADSEEVLRMQKTADEGLKLIAAHDFKATTVVRQGRPAATILEVAGMEKADLVVVGAYGHSRIREMILGSTTTKLVSQSSLPVMLVR